MRKVVSVQSRHVEAIVSYKLIFCQGFIIDANIVEKILVSLSISFY